MVSQPWANGEALAHNGSNGQWISLIWMAPGRDFAVITLCNLGGDTAFDVTGEVAARMIEEFLE